MSSKKQKSDVGRPKKSSYLPKKIISGGQTGVDRGALDTAIALGIEHGGWCPAGRLSEDGTIPSRYELTETDSPDYPARTKQNVIDSDATLILYERKLKGGTLLTQRLCKTNSVKHHSVRLDHDTDTKLAEAIEQAQSWLNKTKPTVLNIAGPRESNYPGIEARSMQFLLKVFAS